MTGGDWDCDAYGPDGREAGALCFLAVELNTRVCTSHAECTAAMTAERRRVFQRIQDGAARGDPDMVYLAGEFTSPEQLLGGPAAAGEGDNG